MPQKKDKHRLYSFRRCPYAMRARMALISAGIDCEVHEVDFKNKPAHLLEISPKGTVPVLQMIDGTVIDESLDILHLALAQNDPHGLINCDKGQAAALISFNDGAFKRALDRYKYPDRYEGEDCSIAREEGLEFLLMLNERLLKAAQLMGAEVSYVDIAIFPFIRQFANVDRAWFEALPLNALQNWLAQHLESALFQKITQKQDENIYSLL